MTCIDYIYIYIYTHNVCYRARPRRRPPGSRRRSRPRRARRVNKTLHCIILYYITVSYVRYMCVYIYIYI